MKAFISTFLICFSFICSLSYGQSKLIRDYQITLQPVVNSISNLDSAILLDPFMMDSIFQDQYDNADFYIGISTLFNTIEPVEKIHIKLGRTAGGDDIFDGYVNISGSGNPAGVNVTINQKQVIIQLGEVINVSELYAEVYAKMKNGMTTAPISKQLKNH